MAPRTHLCLPGYMIHVTNVGTKTSKYSKFDLPAACHHSPHASCPHPPNVRRRARSKEGPAVRRPTKAAETRVAGILAAKERALRDSADVVAKLEREKWQQNQQWRQATLTSPGPPESIPNFRRPTAAAKQRVECSQIDKRKAAVNEGLAEAERQREEFRRNRERKRRSASSPADIGRHKSPSYRRPTSAALQRRKEVMDAQQKQKEIEENTERETTKREWQKRSGGVDRLYNTFEGDEDDDEVETTPPPPNPALMANLMTALKWPAPAESTT